MTRPLTPAEILAALRRWGIPFHEQAGWTTRHNGTGWGDVTGFMWHHTGDDAADDVDLRIVTNGRAGLPGPLAQFGLRDDGSVDLIAAGAANHAGGGDPLVLAAVRKGYTALPAPRYIHGQAGSISGNPLLYGVETYYSGTRAPTPAVAAMMPRLAAAILNALDRIDNTATWTAKRGIGHKEWQRGKVDPGSVNCNTLRTQTQHLLDTPGDAPMSAAEVQTILTALASHEKNELGRYGSEGARYADLAGRAATQLAQIAALTAAVAALAAHPDLTAAQITTIISDAITASVKVTGTLTVVPT